MTSEEKPELLRELLRQAKSVAVAFSGGTDSTFLLKVAHDELGEAVAGFMVVSPFVPARDVAEAKNWCASAGIALRILTADPMADPAVAANPPDRCYHCKKGDFAAIFPAARAGGFAVVCDGSNMDDAGDYRPGQKAMRELGVRSPLRECGLTKAEIRALSRALGLSTWNKPAAACLASRIPYGETITAEKLRRVDRAEEILHDTGFAQVRVRLHGGNLARIETLPEDMARLLALRDELLPRLQALGLNYVALDLRGYRTGSFNETLKSQ